MASEDRNMTGWFSPAQVAEAMHLSEQEFLRAYLDGPDDELVYAEGEPKVHWFSLLRWVEKHYYETSTIGTESPMVKYHIDRGSDPAKTVESHKREDATEGARMLLEELLGIDDWLDGISRRVATNWNMDTLDYEVETILD
ncbi:hypothetical protein [Microbacterium lacticum]|uniref:Uncharacterized protein n=1 Tax=Microbacterium lacticum TaxID=33885 RepID=A0A4Y3USG2_9MICO|nr:hypothetical protein [Microbacterium lacticum]TQM98799.1 hypothetical protein FHX68_1511 [Microbacterium lacticum]GEB96449.1 hypothetical protein MLA01_26680 [Microbacterium lacticum]GGI74642.1 hypothetical protein GCM10009724_27020 [Microbacterium lacticum]